ncbi:hypothetical protein [Corallococcus aberystwythensis]|uniref:Uncharacterized protein n=1 Tax=Corallococcus aberystwythensis TaxID=2316722 RepID=A0A3A8R5N3_9BACT|nr:hypothetical protein [Corallococcus aberystwythensis]RKH72532.1 hypothetical protein D7W81_05930 [Corallococcus aberystwythensis]
MLNRFVSYAVPAAALLLGACGGPETLDSPEVPAESSVATTEQGLSTLTINDFPLSFYVPPKTGGDADFAGHGPRMALNFELEVRNTNELWIGMFIWGDETGGRDTHVFGGQWYHIATTATPIVSVSPSPVPVSDYWMGAEFTWTYTDTGHSLDAWGFPQLASNTRIVQNITCVGDTSGNEAGTKTGCSAVLHDLTITF